MNPDISEFSYGYALTDELIHWHGTALTAAPVFPSLHQEGQTGGGYDVMLRRPGVPLFLQFKLSECLVRNNAQEVKDGIFSVSYYRMHLRPGRHSRQHEMLLDLETDGKDVCYCAPAFHTSEELNEAYLHHQVRDRSVWLRPSEIGPLPDDGDHYVAFRTPGTYYFRSKPRHLETKGDFEEFTRGVTTSYEQKGKTALLESNLLRLAETITETVERRADISTKAKGVSRKELETRHPLQRIAFYSHVFMDCRFFIVREKNSEEGEEKQ